MSLSGCADESFEGVDADTTPGTPGQGTGGDSAGADDTSDATHVGHTSSEDDPLILGTYTSLRPEVGSLNGCTGTLVDPSIVLTAGHCIGYTNANVSRTFTIQSKSGSFKTFAADKTFAFGPGDPSNLSNGLGATDVAMIRLSSPVPDADATPASIATSWPGAGTTQTIFGYGCQNRTTQAGGGSKQYYSFTAGQTSGSLCPGDSGGPVFWYGASSGGPVFAVNSGYHTDSGADMFGDAATYATPGLVAVRKMSNTFTTNFSIASFSSWAAASGAQSLVGDFNNDGLSDLALVGGPGWTTIPVAFSNGNGTFNVTNFGVSSFGAWSSASHAVAGDFNGDGRDDIALVGGPGWTTLPVAFSNGNGTFNVTNQSLGTFAGWGQTAGVQVIAGDFNADGRDDIALTGPSGWSTIPVAFGSSNGTFSVTNKSNPTFASYASQGAHALAGDFDGDGDTDIALTGPGGWGTIPVAFSDRTGGFSVTNNAVKYFPAWASSGAKIVAGDFDGDGRADLAATGGPAWLTVAFALSNGGGSFTAANLPLNNFPAWSSQARYALAGRFNSDGQTDIALSGGSGWGTLPVAFVKR